ncbi:hypothetical protein Pan258_12680 [Symmachiella dynata]|uniref:DUF58 domain-containing protein n=1 Tax=Symmachiella dynata TaxID=2527995 RepID=UPI0011891EBF|nr:DUF58 domain-containing protein [Symmachiella dynata]QDT47237.1 hypothetical protein Pan258_12680 [Symmachiella dynata]
MANTPNLGKLSFEYLQPADLRRLTHMLFAPRRIIHGRYGGHFATNQRGQSVEFRDYREYLPGDDVSKIDWKVLGRSDKLFIKLFEHHSEMTVHLLVDASASMGYRSATSDHRKNASKYDYACMMAASIAFLVMKQHDRFGFAISRDGLDEQIPAQCSMLHLMGILRRMERIRPGGPAGLAEALNAFNRQGSMRNLLVIFSDLWDDPEGVAKAMAARVHGGGEIVLFHVLHPDEIDLPQVEHGVFIDSETGGRVRLHVSEIRAEYQKKAREFIDAWSRRCRGIGVDYFRASLSQPYYRLLEQYLANRASS